MARVDRHLRRHGAPEPRKPSLIDLQKQAVAAARATMNGHDAKRYSELFATDATVDEYGLGEAKGRDGIAAGFKGALNAFPDYKIGVSRIFVKNDLLVQEWIITGTIFGMFMTAFPDAKVSSHALFGVDGVVVSESSITATHVGPLGLLQPTRLPVTMHALDIMVVKDGKVLSGTTYSNSLELLKK